MLCFLRVSKSNTLLLRADDEYQCPALLMGLRWTCTLVLPLWQPQQASHFPTLYTECPRRNGQNFGRVFLMLNYTDITQNTYIQSWTVTEIMTIEKCWLLGCPRTVSRPWHHTHPLRMSGNEKPLANIGIQWPWRDNEQLRPAYITCKPKDNYDVSASVFVVQFNGFMSLTSYFDVKYSY